MKTLKDIHPYLYARVRLKAIVDILLGSALILTDHLPRTLTTDTANSTQLNYFLSFDVWGGIFLVLGLGILIGLHAKDPHFTWSRRFLRMSFSYALFWFVILNITIITGHPKTTSVMILWGYWVWNQWLVGNDPGWGALDIIRRAHNGR